MHDKMIVFDTRDPGELARLVTRVDPGLEFLKDLHPLAPGCRTLLVRQGEVERVLKVRQLSNNTWDDTYFYYEIHALRRVAERKLTRVVHLTGEYRSDTHHAILKTYAKGTPLNTIDHEAMLLDEAFIRKLDALYLKLHLAGIAKIHFQPRKIIIAPDGELVLVDLNTCVVNTESGVQVFSQEMRADSRFITRLEKRAKKARQDAAGFSRRPSP